MVGNPPKWCTVPISEIIEKGLRLEASVYDVDAKRAWKNVMNGKYSCVPLMGEKGLIKEAFYPGRFKRIYCDRQHGEPFFLPSQMTDIYPKTDKYISRLTRCDISKLRLERKTLLLTRSGTIGTVGYVSKTMENQVYSDDVIRVKFKHDYDLGYCYTFLKSRDGSKVLQTNGYGSVITHLEPDHLREIPVPDAPVVIRGQINECIQNSYELRDISNSLIDKATDMLLKELRLPSLAELEMMDDKESFNVPLSRLNYRLDGSYHVPVVDRIRNCLMENASEVTTLGDKRISKRIILAGIFKRTYVEEEYGYPFLGGKEICQLMPETEKFLSKAIHKERYEKELKVEKNTILVTDRGTIGTTVMVPEHWNGYAVSQNVLKLVPASDEIAGYIYIFLNSDIGNILIKRHTYGSVVDMIDNNSLSAVELPLLSNQKVQKEINDLALQANDLRYRAYLLEKEALDIMNNEIL